MLALQSPFVGLTSAAPDRAVCALISLRHYQTASCLTWRHHELRAPAASPIRARRAGRGASAAAEAGLSAAEVERRVSKACNLVATADKLVPYDPRAVNLALIVWVAIRDIPEQDRVQMVSRLSSADIRRLWKVAGQRYAAPPGAAMAALGPDYSVWRDLPSTGVEGEVAYHRGRAALPLHALGLSAFTKAFFQRREPGEDGEELFGRVVHPNPLANWLLPGPMYFRCRVGAAVAPMLGEACDMTVSYEEPEALGLGDDDIPRPGWPRPRRQRRPFDAGYTEYVRAAGPGVFVGVGYRTRAAGSGVPLVPSPLHFVMARERTEAGGQ